VTAAQVGRTFGAAEEYDLYRPGYPAGAVAFIRTEAGLDEHSTVVDLGAGTGLMTRLLLPVGRLIAVEPLSDMREVLHARVPEAEIVEGTAEGIHLPSKIADAVVAAQAFHWFANAVAVREIARILRPTGALFMVWNENDPSDSLLRVIDEVLARYRGDTPRFRTSTWRDALETDDSPLVITDHRTFPFEERLSLRHLERRMLSWSYIASLDSRGRAAVVRELQEVASGSLGTPLGDDTVVFLRQLTEVFVARLRGATSAPV